MENNKKYLTEENYQKNNEKVKKIGKVLLIIGLILLTIGFVLLVSGFLGFGNQITSGMGMTNGEFNSNGLFAGFSSFAIGGLLMSPGLFLTMLGLIFRYIIGNRREITAYTVQQTMPIAKEGIDEMAPVIGNAAGEIARGIKKGLGEEK